MFVVGNPLHQTLSPIMYNCAFEKLGLTEDFAYFALETKYIDKAISLLREDSMIGCSVTIPFKEKLFGKMDRTNISKEAHAIGAINTLVKNNSILYGHNTDWIGFQKCIKKHADVSKLKNKKALIFGGGGASKAVIYALTDLGMDITVYSRSNKAPKDVFPSNPKLVKVISSVQDIDPEIKMMVNTTPLGMKGHEGEDKSPIDKKWITKDMICVDVVYNPLETVFLKDAKSKGAKVIPGLDMLVYQGAEAFKLWTGKAAPISVMRQCCINKLKN